MSGGMKPFLEEGVRRYDDAKHTIAAFENELCQLLKAAVERRHKWSPLMKTKVYRPNAGGGSGG